MCRTLWLLILSTAAAGFAVGILDTATNVQLIGIHGKKVSAKDSIEINIQIEKKNGVIIIYCRTLRCGAAILNLITSGVWPDISHRPL